MVKIKLITLQQPMAYLFCTGAKVNETRTFRTHYRGTMYIHAGKTFYFDDANIVNTNEHFRKCITEPYKQLITSAIIGKVDIVDCVPTQSLKKLTKQEQAFGDYSPGRFAWIGENHTLFERPILSILGQLGVWELELPEEYIL